MKSLSFSLFLFFILVFLKKVVKRTTNDTQFLAERLVSDIACNHDELDEAVFSMISTAINTTPTVSHSRASSENTSSQGMLVEGLNTVTSTLASAAATAANALGQVVHGLAYYNQLICICFDYN